MILVVGEALVDVVEHPDGSRTEHPGGSPANVAVGLGRAGLDVTLATTLGDDRFGELIRRHLAESHVNVVASPAGRTSSAVARLDADGAADYEFDVSWDPDLTDPPTTPDAVHTGSIAASLAPGADAVEALLKRRRSTSIVTFDPNVRPSLTPHQEEVADRVERLVRLADVVKVSDEDLRWLHAEETVDDTATRWLESGPAMVVVTRGADGSTAFARAGRIDEPARETSVVDTVGAGDAYMSGLLAGLHEEGFLDLDSRAELREIGGDALRRVTTIASRSAAWTVGRAGAQPPTRDELWP